jgi:hypothetical protein
MIRICRGKSRRDSNQSTIVELEARLEEAKQRAAQAAEEEKAQLQELRRSVDRLMKVGN